MHLTYSADQEALHDAVANLYGKESTPERVRAAEDAGHDQQLWQAFAQMGLPTMGVPTAQGGGGASLTDLAVVAEQHGRHLGSAPLIETMVAARLLARCPAGGARLLTELHDGALAGLALHPARDGRVRLVPGGSVAQVVLALDGEALVAVSPSHPPARSNTLHAGPVADVSLEDAVVLATAEEGGTRLYRTALEEWRVLQAAALAGLARAALDLGLQYVKDRKQFGVTLGSFQSIQHRLADLHTQTDGARLLAYEAAWAADEDQPNRSALASQAFWLCGETAVAAADSSLHYHGGYGFMLEYDIQLYSRRAKGWRLLAGDPRDQLREVVRHRWLSSSPEPAATKPDDAATMEADAPDAPDSPERGMDFSLDAESLAVQREVREVLAEHLTPDVVARAHASGTMHDWGLHRVLCKRGYLAAGWPTEVGGLGHSAVATSTLLQELYRAGAPVDGMGIAAMVGATLLLKGNDQQRERILPRILAGEVLCCLGYSEPDAGSDVAAVQTRAVRDGDQWVIDGQKMFTTMAHEAEYVFLLTRTDPTVPVDNDSAEQAGRNRYRKHQSLTMFLVPMSTPGIEVTPVETLGGERTNITFYSEVRVPDACRVGEVNDGWSVMHAALVYERAGANWGEPAHLVDSVARWAVTEGLMEDPTTQERMARWDTLLEAGRLLLYRAAWMAAAGGLPQVEGSMAKLLLTETFVAAAADLQNLCGAAGLLRGDEADAVLHGLVEHASRHALVTTIYGGSSEVQREIVAQRGLGLPRHR